MPNPVEGVLTERYAVLGERIEGDRSKLSLGMSIAVRSPGRSHRSPRPGNTPWSRNLIALKGLREEPQPFVSIRSFRMGKGMGEKAWQVKIHCVATTC
jgi:hypothetical protein